MSGRLRRAYKFGSLAKEGADSKVVCIDRLRLGDDSPIALNKTWLLLGFGALLNRMDLTQETIHHILVRRYAIPVFFAAFYIGPAEATARQAEYLEVAPVTALLVIQRISYTTQYEPVYIQERYYRPDRVQYRVTLRRHNDEGSGSKNDESRTVFAQ